MEESRKQLQELQQQKKAGEEGVIASLRKEIEERTKGLTLWEQTKRQR